MGAVDGSGFDSGLGLLLAALEESPKEPGLCVRRGLVGGWIGGRRAAGDVRRGLVGDQIGRRDCVR